MILEVFGSNEAKVTKRPVLHALHLVETVVKESFNWVSRKFSFIKLLMHDSHRSYPGITRFVIA